VPGDPLIVLRTLARQVRDRGIRRISGHVIVDASLFPEGDRELGTGVVISPIVLNDNLVDVTVTPRSDGAPALLTVSPPTAYVRFINKVVTAAAGTRPRIRWSSDSMRTDGSRVVVASGVFPRGAAPILYSYAVPQPSRYAEMAFAEALRAEGVAASPRVYSVRPDLVRLRSSYGPANMVAEHRSASLGEEVRVTLKVSQNLHASMMPYLLGALRGRDSATTGFDLEREFLTTLGLDVSGARQGDGAGGDAHFTPAFMVSVLGAMAKRPDANTFLTAMPVLGKDGTLWDIQQQSPAAGHVFAKTGTFAVEDPLNRKLLVTGKGLAGYMTTAQGERLAFAIYVHNVPVSTAPDEIKRVVGQALPVGASDHLLAGAADERIAPGLVLQENGVGRVVHEGAEALLVLLDPAACPAHRAAQRADQQRGHGVGEDLDDLRHAAVDDGAARLDEQQLAARPAGGRGEQRRRRAAVPGGDDDGAEQGDEGNPGAEPRVERQAQAEGCADGEQCDDVR
jgi:D-alanyl-D-alanine carboxypeptidase/D-alanyl-D-alanine-endopeptidase (penicillin-binding protein 4)